MMDHIVDKLCEYWGLTAFVAAACAVVVSIIVSGIRRIIIQSMEQKNIARHGWPEGYVQDMVLIRQDDDDDDMDI